MKLQYLKNHELHEKLNALSLEEIKLEHHILIHITEVVRRKLFLEMSYPNLYLYLTEGIGFTAGSAQRRIDAASLLQQIPEINHKIFSGTINLGQLNLVQKAVRYLKHKRGISVSLDDKKDIIDKIENKTTKQSFLLIAKNFDLQVLKVEKKIYQSDESIRLELNFSKEEMEILENTKALLSHSLSGGNFKDMIIYLANQAIKKKTNSRVPSKKLKREKNAQSVNKNTVSVPKLPLNAGVSSSIRKKIFQKDLFCQHKDPKTNKVCGSKYFLEVDHIRPKWAGGTNSIDNLRALCSSHNKFRYIEGR